MLSSLKISFWMLFLLTMSTFECHNDSQQQTYMQQHKHMIKLLKQCYVNFLAKI